MPGHGHRTTPSERGRRMRRSAVLLLVVGLVLFLPAPALANEEETEEARLLVLQSVALIANEAPVDAVIERIEDALAAPDPSGTDLPAVKRALGLVERSASEDDPADLQRAREILVAAVDARFATGYGEIPRPDAVGEGESPYATGAETGTTAVLDELRPAWGITDGGDLVLLILSALAIGAGLYLAHRWRPHDSIRQLRRAQAGTGEAP